MSRRAPRPPNPAHQGSGRYKMRECPPRYDKECPKKHDICLAPGEEPPFCPRVKPLIISPRTRPPRCPDKEDPCYIPPPPPPPQYNQEACPEKEPIWPCFEKRRPLVFRDCDPSEDDERCGKK